MLLCVHAHKHGVWKLPCFKLETSRGVLGRHERTEHYAYIDYKTIWLQTNVRNHDIFSRCIFVCTVMHGVRIWFRPTLGTYKHEELLGAPA
jgi:hypothetical protein